MAPPTKSELLTYELEVVKAEERLRELKDDPTADPAAYREAKHDLRTKRMAFRKFRAEAAEAAIDGTVVSPDTVAVTADVEGV